MTKEEYFLTLSAAFFNGQITESTFNNLFDYYNKLDTLCSTCELFTDINTSFVPIHKFIKNCNLFNHCGFSKKSWQPLL